MKLNNYSTYGTKDWKTNKGRFVNMQNESDKFILPIDDTSIQLTKYFSNYMSNSHVNVNCISPAGVENKNTQTKSFIKRYSQKIPSKRMAKADEISNLILFLLSNKSNYINGENIVIDGGYSSKL